MRKDAFNPSETWDDLKANPITGTAMSIGSFLPISGGVIAGGDMFNNLYKGNYATAGLNAVQAAAGLLPGGDVGVRMGGSLVSRLAGLGRAGRMAANAGPHIATLP